jgi:hypothetical protein
VAGRCSTTSSAYVVGKSRGGFGMELEELLVGKSHGPAVAVRRLSEADDGDRSSDSGWCRRRAFETKLPPSAARATYLSSSPPTAPPIPPCVSPGRPLLKDMEQGNKNMDLICYLFLVKKSLHPFQIDHSNPAWMEGDQGEEGDSVEHMRYLAADSPSLGGFAPISCLGLGNHGGRERGPESSCERQTERERASFIPLAWTKGFLSREIHIHCFLSSG